MREACRGAAVVYHCAMPQFRRWVELFPPMMEAVIEGSAYANAKLVFADDTWMYGKVSGPMTEDLPYRPVSDTGVLRAWLAEMLLRAHDRGRVRATIGRASELYGPVVESVLGRNLFGAALKGKKARFTGDLDQPLTPTFIEDFAEALIVIGGREEALGEAWHVPTAEHTTGREFVRKSMRSAARTPRSARLGAGWRRRSASCGPWRARGQRWCTSLSGRSSWTPASTPAPSAEAVPRRTARGSGVPSTGTVAITRAADRPEFRPWRITPGLRRRQREGE